MEEKKNSNVHKMKVFLKGFAIGMVEGAIITCTAVGAIVIGLVIIGSINGTLTYDPTPGTRQDVINELQAQLAELQAEEIGPA